MANVIDVADAEHVKQRSFSPGSFLAARFHFSHQRSLPSEWEKHGMRIGALVLCFGLAACVAAQEATSPAAAASAATAVPALVAYSGSAVAGDGKLMSGNAAITVLIFKDEHGGEPLFTETQTVALDAAGRYTLQIGSTLADGLPADLFATGEARWLEAQIAGQPAQPRVLLVSVPYALKAADAATLGGLPASAFALAGAGNDYISTKPATAGTITGVVAGSGLKGGGTSGSVTLSVNPSVVPTIATDNTFTGANNFGNAVNFFSEVSVSVTGSIPYPAFTASSSNVGGPNSGYGVVGTSFSPAEGRSGVLGQAGSGSNSVSNSVTFGLETAHHVAGVWGDTLPNPNTGGSAAGVIGTADKANAGAFFNNATSFAALYAQNQAGPGVNGVLTSASKRGATVTYKSGVWADTSATAQTALLATADESYGGLFYNNGSNYATLYAENDASTSSTAQVFHTASSHFGGYCIIDVSGNLSCNGKSVNVVSVENGARKVETYSMQSPENWLEDFGSGQLSSGAVRIDLDPTFAQTVNAGVEYHVFLTANADCKGLYASSKTASSFEVHELGGGTSSVAFDYRIVAKRAGYESSRLTDVTDRIIEKR